jgi:hypothetical protein
VTSRDCRVNADRKKIDPRQGSEPELKLRSGQSFRNVSVWGTAQHSFSLLCLWFVAERTRRRFLFLRTPECSSFFSCQPNALQLTYYCSLRTSLSTSLSHSAASNPDSISIPRNYPAYLLKSCCSVSDSSKFCFISFLRDSSHRMCGVWFGYGYEFHRAILRHGIIRKEETRSKLATVLWGLPCFEGSLLSKWRWGEPLPKVSHNRKYARILWLSFLLRCARDKKQCIFLEIKPRPKRVRTSKTWVKPPA